MRRNWFAQGRYNYTGIDEYENSELRIGPVITTRTKKLGRDIANLANRAYSLGRQDMLDSLQSAGYLTDNQAMDIRELEGFL